MKLVITLHAQERMDFHGVSEEQVKVATQRGAKTPQTDGFLIRYTYLNVAYKITGELYIIKTVFIER